MYFTFWIRGQSWNETVIAADDETEAATMAAHYMHDVDQWSKWPVTVLMIAEGEKRSQARRWKLCRELRDPIFSVEEVKKEKIHKED